MARFGVLYGGCGLIIVGRLPSKEAVLANETSRDHLETCESFDLGELKGLCFELEIDYEQINGSNKREFARELVLYLERRGKLHRLLWLCKQKRPSAFALLSDEVKHYLAHWQQDVFIDFLFSHYELVASVFETPELIPPSYFADIHHDDRFRIVGEYNDSRGSAIIFAGFFSPALSPTHFVDGNSQNVDSIFGSIDHFLQHLTGAGNLAFNQCLDNYYRSNEIYYYGINDNRWNPTSTWLPYYQIEMVAFAGRRDHWSEDQARRLTKLLNDLHSHGDIDIRATFYSYDRFIEQSEWLERNMR